MLWNPSMREMPCVYPVVFGLYKYERFHHYAKSTSLVGDGIGSLAIHYSSQWPIYSTQTQGVANVWTVTKHLHKPFSTVCWILMNHVPCPCPHISQSHDSCNWTNLPISCTFHLVQEQLLWKKLKDNTRKQWMTYRTTQYRPRALTPSCRLAGLGRPQL